MTHRNDKRNNRHNRQRNNKTELSPFASMLFGALLGKGTEMIAEKMTEGITNKDINNDNVALSKLRIPADGSAVEYPVPDGLFFFFDEEGKLMVRKKIEGDEKPTKDDKEGNHITYDDICKELFLKKTAYWAANKDINSCVTNEHNYNDIDNCTSIAQAKRLAAFNKLQNIAKYLNKGWKPDFCDHEKKWCIAKDGESFSTRYNQAINDASVYFKNEDLTKEAIRLMGEESLNDLFSTDW